jgi:hypothetical protein
VTRLRVCRTACLPFRPRQPPRLPPARRGKPAIRPERRPSREAARPPPQGNQRRFARRLEGTGLPRRCALRNDASPLVIARRDMVSGRAPCDRRSGSVHPGWVDCTCQHCMKNSRLVVFTRGRHGHRIQCPYHSCRKWPPVSSFFFCRSDRSRAWFRGVLQKALKAGGVAPEMLLQILAEPGGK